jgi:SpoVK/Ycf46/Vps4 family AAA+-type ATPase
MDGVREPWAPGEVVILASAPSTERLDPAVYRPGRLDLLIELPAPTPETISRLVVDRLNPLLNEITDGGGEDVSKECYSRVMHWIANKRPSCCTYADGVDLARSVIMSICVMKGEASPLTVEMLLSAMDRITCGSAPNSSI